MANDRRHTGPALALTAREGMVFVAGPREVLAFSADGARQQALRAPQGEFDRAAFGEGLLVTADDGLQLRLWSLPDLKPQAHWLFDTVERLYGQEQCRVTALALDAQGLWVAISDCHYDEVESGFMDPAFTTEWSLRRYSLEGLLLQEYHLPSRALALAATAEEVSVLLDTGQCGQVGSSRVTFDQERHPGATTLAASSAGLWLGHTDGTVARRENSGSWLKSDACDPSPVTALYAGTNLLVGHRDGSVVARHGQTLAQLSCEKPHGGPITALLEDAQGRVISASQDGPLCIHGSLPQGHRGPIEALAFHPGLHQLASASFDEMVGLWELPSLGSQRFLPGHQGPVRCLAFAGHTLISGGKDGTVRLWGEAPVMLRGSGRVHLEEAGTWTRLVEPISTLAVSPCQRWLVWGGDEGKLEIYDLARRESASPLIADRGGVRAVAFRPDGDAIMVAGDHGLEVRRWADHTPLAATEAFWGQFRFAAWHSSDLGAGADWNGNLFLFHGGEFHKIPLNLNGYLTGLAFDEQARLVTVSVGEQGDWLRIHDLRGMCLVERPCQGKPSCLAVGGNTVAIGKADGGLEVVHL